MAERRPNLPEWTFRDGSLVTVNKIRRERLGENWIGDESNGSPEGQTHTGREGVITIEEQLKIF